MIITVTIPIEEYERLRKLDGIHRTQKELKDRAAKFFVAASQKAGVGKANGVSWDELNTLISNMEKSIDLAFEP